jgi:asparagine N-glycosylation enzyme membrane subunit Stt3
MDSSDERKIIFESKPKVIFSIIISWGFTIMCAWSGYIFGFLFFGLCAVLITILCNDLSGNRAEII